MSDAVEREQIRIIEAVLFAAVEPLDLSSLADRLPSDLPRRVPLEELVRLVAEKYADGGFRLVRIGDKYAFRTAPDLADALQSFVVRTRRPSRAALETLAIIAYHQPCTRAEIEEIRGVQLSSGTLDTLLRSDWIRIRGRRRVPGRPLTYGTTDAFLSHFDLTDLNNLPGLSELRAAGLLDNRLPPDFDIPMPGARDDEEEKPLGDDDSGDEMLV